MSEQPPDHYFYDMDVSESPPYPGSPGMNREDEIMEDTLVVEDIAEIGSEIEIAEIEIAEIEIAEIEIADPPMSQERSVSSPSVSRSSSPVPGTWRPSQVRIPDSVTDASRYPLNMERFFHQNGLMQPRDQDLSSLDANGKAWVMERPPLSLPMDGITWSFVDECHAGITNELLKVIYFFEIMNGTSNHFHWNGFVVGTTDFADQTSLQPSFAPNNKDINGVVLSQFTEPDGSLSFKGLGRGVDTNKLLSASELSSSGTVITPQELFRISVSFTAAVFESSRVRNVEVDNEDEQRQAIFGVVSITALRNVDTLRLIVVTFDA